MTGSAASPSFRLAYVPGATPAKWVRIWRERLPGVPLELVPVPAAEACAMLRAGGADAGLVRLPVDRTFFSAIPLYTETTVVVVARDHVVTAADEVTPADLSDEVVFHPLDEVLEWERRPGLPARERPATTADAVELAAAGVGVAVVPQSLARLHHRRDVAYRPVSGAPASSVALAWPEEATTDLVDDFIGIVRGRTVNSTRGRRPPAEQQQDPRRGGDGGRRKTSGGDRSGGRSAGSSGGGRGRSGGRNPRGGTGRGHGSGRGRPRRRS